jgi:microsomal dipeptidase-like Zn-dependent dipeptidase
VPAYDLRGRTSGHTDLARLVQGQVGAQFWSVYLPGDIKDSGFARVQLEQIDLARQVIARYPERLALALSAGDIEREFKRGRIASLIGMEGGHAVEEWDAASPRPRATPAQVADHIEHVRAVAGVDHVGIGSDFDGIDTVPVGLEDVSTFPDLLAELARRGWSDADLAKLAGQNLLRVFHEAEAVARRLQKERGPSTRTIEELDRPPS